MSGNSIVHPGASITPTKLELLQGWLPAQPWFDGDASDITRVASYRLVDPDGEVGMEGVLFRSAGKKFHTAMTYRSEPIEDRDSGLIGVTEHSVLGKRYVYDAPADPVFVAELMRVIRDGDTGADLLLAEGEPIPTDMRVEGSGIPAISHISGMLRLLTDAPAEAPAQSRGLLVGTYREDGEDRAVVLATLK